MINHVDTRELNEILDRCILGSDKSEVLSQERLAYDAYKYVDEKNIAPHLARWGCILELRRLAGPKIKGAFHDYDDPAMSQGDLFEGFQDRYHAFRNGEHVAVPEDQLTLLERHAVESRMQKEIDKKRKHLARFSARTQQLIAEGYFDDIAV